MVQSLKKLAMPLVWLGLLTLICFLLPEVLNAQGLKISSLSDVESKVQESSTSAITITKYVFGALFGVSGIFLLWAVLSKKADAKDFAVSWFIGLILYFIIVAIV